MLDDISNVTLRINIEGDIGQLKSLSQQVKKNTKANTDFLNSFNRLRVSIVSAIIAYGALKTAVEGVIKPSAQYQATLLGLEKVSANTGRSFDEMKGLVNDLQKEFGGMVDKATLANAALKLSSTQLSTDQMKKFIKVVADGAAAMGEDFATQLPIVTKGFKQLNPAIIDNIGINVRLDKVASDTAKALGKTRTALTENEKQLGLYNAIMEQAYVVEGAFIIQQDTLMGQFARLKTSLNEVALLIGESGLLDDLTNIVRVTADLIDAVSELDPQLVRWAFRITAITLAYKGLMKVASLTAGIQTAKAATDIFGMSSSAAGLVSGANTGLVGALTSLSAVLSRLVPVLALIGTGLATTSAISKTYKPLSEEAIANELYNQRVGGGGGTTTSYVMIGGKPVDFTDMNYKDIINPSYIPGTTISGPGAGMANVPSRLTSALSGASSVQDLSGAWLRYKQVMDDVNSITPTTITEFEQLQDRIANLNTSMEKDYKLTEDQIKLLPQFYEELERAREEADRLAKEMRDNLASQAFTLLGFAIDDVNNKIEENQANIEKLEGSIETIFNRRFAGETEFQKRLYEQELAIKQFKYDNFELLNSIEETSRGMEKETDAYQAWIDTVDQSIKSLINQGAGSDITLTLRQLQASRLGVSQFSYDKKKGLTPTEKKLKELELAYEKDRLEFELNFSAKRSELELWEQANEDAAYGVITSLDLTEQQILSNRESLSRLITETENLEAEKERLSKTLSTWQRDWYYLNNEIQKNISLASKAASLYSKASSSTSSSRDIINSYVSQYGSLPGAFKIVNGEIVPMASGGLITKPTLVLAGESGPEMITPLHGAGGNTISNMNSSTDNRQVSIVINGYNQSPFELANEIKRKLSTRG